MRTLLISLALAFVVFCAQDTDTYVSDMFDFWAAKHGKAYKEPNERLTRLENFKATLKRIDDSNARTAERGIGATYGLNKFSDLTPEEFAATVLMRPFKGAAESVKRKNLLKPTPLAAPESFDWRPKGAVTPIKDQGQCGSCWAFSVTENIESMWMIAKGLTNSTMTPLAPQQVVDCDKSDYGCDGGNPPTAYDYIKEAGGLEGEKDYPYKAEDGTCHFKKSDVVATISDWKYATTSYDETTLKDNLVSWGPLSICVDARFWQDYESGVMGTWECDWVVELDHCVQGVGYDLTASTPYWVLRNSWGTDWGEKGYIRVEYGGNTCGLTSEATSSVI